MSKPIGDPPNDNASKTNRLGVGRTPFGTRNVSIGARIKKWLCSITFLNLGKFFSKALTDRTAEVIDPSAPIEERLPLLVERAEKENLQPLVDELLRLGSSDLKDVLMNKGNGVLDTLVGEAKKKTLNL
jgi:hypothetical protein